MKSLAPLLAAIIISSILSPFLSAAINVALPQISNDLGLSASGMSWVNMSFLLASAAFLIPLGKLADRVGRKQIFLAGNIIVLFTSVFCIVVSDSLTFLVLRFIQGIGSSMMFVTATAMVTAAFPKEKRGRYIGYNVMAVYLGLSAAPVLGGLLVEAFSWESLFYTSVINNLAVIILMLFYREEKLSGASKTPFDLTGSVLFVVSMTLLMYGFAHATDWLAQIMATAGLAGLIFFIAYEWRQKDPVFDVRFFAGSRIFAFSNLAALINYAATFAVGFLLSLYFQYNRGLSPADTGKILMIQPVFMAIAATISGRLSDKTDPRLLASAGMLLSAIGVGLLFFINDQTPNTFFYIALFVLGLGFGLFSTPNTHAVMSSVEPRQFGMASASISTMRISGQMISMGLATLFIHWLIGASRVTPQNAFLLTEVMHYVFGIFFVLSLLGIWLSWARKSSETHSASV